MYAILERQKPDEHNDLYRSSTRLTDASHSGNDKIILHPFQTDRMISHSLFNLK